MLTASTDPATSVAGRADNATDWIGFVVDYSARLLAQYGFRLLGALVVVAIAYVVAGLTWRAVYAALLRARLEPTTSKFTANLSRYVVLILGLMSCAPILGINITAFAALLGAGGLAVGLASQGALSNGAAGLMLLFTQPFKAGDTIVVDGIAGSVDEVQLFSTTLNTSDNRRIFIPNNAIFGKVIENSTHNPWRSTTFFTVVAPDSDVRKVRAALQRAGASCSAVLPDPAPEVFLVDLLDGGLKWSITVWAETRQLSQARDQAIVAVRDALRHEKIAGPNQVTTVRLLEAARQSSGSS